MVNKSSLFPSTTFKVQDPITMSSRNSEAAPSSPPQENYGPDEQLRSEAAASQNSLQPPTDGTTQNSSQAPPASSPLFFRSSPANDGVAGMSSPMRQASTVPSDGGPTPRASGQTIGGAFAVLCSDFHDWLTWNLRLIPDPLCIQL